MSTMRLQMRAGERLYINGAVLRFSRRAEVELLNDAAFLLEAHVMQEEQATTPLRQLYFMLQTMLIDPDSRRAVAALFSQSHAQALTAFDERAVIDGLEEIAALAAEGRIFEAMKRLRGLFAAEDRLAANGGDGEDGGNGKDSAGGIAAA